MKQGQKIVFCIGEQTQTGFINGQFGDKWIVRLEKPKKGSYTHIIIDESNSISLLPTPVTLEGLRSMGFRESPIKWHSADAEGIRFSLPNRLTLDFTTRCDAAPVDCDYVHISPFNITIYTMEEVYELVGMSLDDISKKYNHPLEDKY